MEDITSVVNRIRSNNKLNDFDESRTKQYIILPILSSLGWDVFDDEVEPEFSVGTNRVDYMLKSPQKIKVFIEVKKVREDIERHQEQILGYAFKRGIELAVLTNGIIWWFYLPLTEGDWEDRRVISIDLINNEVDETSQHLIRLLSKEYVLNEKSILFAKELYGIRKLNKTFTDSLPEAWDNIINQTHPTLIDLIKDQTEEICGFRPSTEIVIGFFKTLSKKQTEDHGSNNGISKRNHQIKKLNKQSSQTHGGVNFTQFTFLGKVYKPACNNQILLKLSEILFSEWGDKFFNKVTPIRGTKKEGWTKKPNSSELQKYKKIENSDIYVYVSLNNDMIYNRAYDLIDAFGYKKTDLEIIETPRTE